MGLRKYIKFFTVHILVHEESNRTGPRRFGNCLEDKLEFRSFSIPVVGVQVITIFAQKVHHCTQQVCIILKQFYLVEYFS